MYGGAGSRTQRYPRRGMMKRGPIVFLMAVVLTGLCGSPGQAFHQPPPPPAASAFPSRPWRSAPRAVCQPAPLRLLLLSFPYHPIRVFWEILPSGRFSSGSARSFLEDRVFTDLDLVFSFKTA